jgi:hypothetical protein
LVRIGRVELEAPDRYGPTRMRRPVPLLAATALLAACGSGDDPGPTRADYIKRADAICAKSNRELAETNLRLAEQARTAKRLSVFTENLEEGNQIAREGLQRIRRIEVPRGAEDEVERVFRSRQYQLDLIDQLTAAARREDAGKFAQLSGQIQRARQQAQLRARRFGFKVCGRDVGGSASR